MSPQLYSQVSIFDPGQGIFNFSGNATGLSGLTWESGNNFYAISDENNSPRIHSLSVNVDSNTGVVNSAAVGSNVSLSNGFDAEGVAYNPINNSFFVSDEGQFPSGGAIREFNSVTGGQIQSVPLPAVVLNNRNNLGLESLTLNNRSLWSSTEQSLANESALSTASSGSLVRLFHLDLDFGTSMQFVYEADSYGQDSPFIMSETSGVSDLLSLPNGDLLVLERALGIGVIPTYRNRIYQVDFSSATEVSNISDLDNGGYVKAGKTLLWEQDMGSVATHNFEGLSLGETLNDGTRSLLLIADNGGGMDQHLYALRLSIPEPSTPLLNALGFLMLLSGRKRR